MFSQEYGTGKYTTECTMVCTMVCQSDAMDSPIFISILDSGFFSFLIQFSIRMGLKCEFMMGNKIQ